jgi:hypothetical protein
MNKHHSLARPYRSIVNQVDQTGHAASAIDRIQKQCLVMGSAGNGITNCRIDLTVPWSKDTVIDLNIVLV